jgi:ankyrin repeat protein
MTHPKRPSALDRELADAAFVCDLRRVRDLLRQGADPDVRNDDEGRPPLVSAVLGGSLALMGLLLESGADVNARDDHGWTALHFTAEEVLPEMASLLIAKGADVDAQDEEGNTPLARAIFSARGRGDVVRLLRQHGAKPDIPNRAGETPRQMADRLGEPAFAAN